MATVDLGQIFCVLLYFLDDFFLICFHRQVNNHQVQHAFRGRFSKYIFTASAHFIKVGGCIVVIGINLKALMASITQALISVGGMFIGFSGGINCNFLQNLIYDWSVFFHSPHIEYGLLVTGQFIIIRRSSFLLSKRVNISPYDSFSSSVVLSNFFCFDLIQK